MAQSEIKSKIADKKAEAIRAFLNVNSSNPSDYRYQQGMIHGLEIALGIVEADVEREDDAHHSR